jgi:hypothetical protein
MVSDGKPYCFEYGTLAASNMTMIKVAGATEFSNCTCTKCDGTDGATAVVSGGITITCPPVSEIYGQSPNLGIQGSGSAFTVSTSEDSFFSGYILYGFILIVGAISVLAGIMLYKNLTRESRRAAQREREIEFTTRHSPRPAHATFEAVHGDAGPPIVQAELVSASPGTHARSPNTQYIPTTYARPAQATSYQPIR